MRIFIDCSHIDFRRQATGIPRVVLHYVEAGYRWAKRSGIEVFPVVTTASGPIVVRPVPGAGVPDYLDKFQASSPTAKEFEQQLNLASFNLQSALMAGGVPSDPVACQKGLADLFENLASASTAVPSMDVLEGDVLFCPAYWHDVPPVQFERLKRAGSKIVTLVHDILPVTLPKFYQSPWKEQFEANLISAIRYSDKLYAVSNYTADSIRELCARKGLADPDIGIAYNGFSPLVSSDWAKRLSEPDFKPAVGRTVEYRLIREERPFLMVGTLEPKKGHIPTIRSLEALWDSGFARPLVIVGRKGWLERDVVGAIEGSPYYRSKLFWFDHFDDLDLSYAYEHCRALIFSSFAEGFGIPMVECLASRHPVVAYDTEIAREVIGNYGLFFRTFGELAEHLIYLDSDDGFDRARKKISKFRWPSWDEVTLPIFDQLAQL